MGNVTTQPHGDGRTYLNPQVIKSAKCEDTGQYRCQVDGTNQSKTVTLLVKCPPQFRDFNDANRTSQVLYGADEDLNFRIFSYKNISNCTLKSHQNEQLLECKSNRSEYVVSGALPYWNLRLTIKNVSEEDNGTWQLNVGNGFQGVATVNFTLDVMLLVKTKEDDMSLWWKPLPIIISCVVVVAALGLCVIITVCYRTRKKSKGTQWVFVCGCSVGVMFVWSVRL
ncbi:uncharacterized protein [Littorina saxatilis]|uniref:uncharacterized protein n=1 Tax=Littorina saxatilis TaxID=31220 RepID=UPI0038B64E1A